MRRDIESILYLVRDGWRLEQVLTGVTIFGSSRELPAADLAVLAESLFEELGQTRSPERAEAILRAWSESVHVPRIFARPGSAARRQR